MADHNHDGEFEDQSWELARWYIESSEVYDLTEGDRPPLGQEWEDVAFVTVNFRPDLSEGMYRNYYVDGFNDDYTLEDLVWDEMAGYGMVTGG